METTTTRNLNTVQTVLSEDAVTRLESILYWFWNEFDPDHLTEELMQMLSVYIKANPDVIKTTHKPEWIADRVSMILQLNERLTAIREEAKPWEWVDAPHGWELPEKVSK